MEFRAFSKIARLSREITISEKLDGTNGVIAIGEDGEFRVGSRNRWITPENDNYGFAKWAMEHKEDLLTLGVGFHYGEYWGQGIQRNYGLKEKRLSLFNVRRWCLHNEEPKIINDANPKEIKYQNNLPECCLLVPVLYEGVFDTKYIDATLESLALNGSVAAPRFMNAEGIVIYHKASGTMFKKTVENDERPKGR